MPQLLCADRLDRDARAFPGVLDPATRLRPVGRSLVMPGQSMPNERIALVLGLSLQTMQWNLRNASTKPEVPSR